MAGRPRRAVHGLSIASVQRLCLLHQRP